MQRIDQRITIKVWIPEDFLDLDGRDAVDKVLQRMVNSGDLRRIGRGLYDKPGINPLTQKLTAADYRSVIEAIGRREHVRLLIDGVTAANDLGLTNVIPGRVIVRTDGRIRPIQLDNLVIEFKQTTPSKLYWAGHPAMRIVQALYWFHDSIKTDEQLTKEIKTKLINWLNKSDYRSIICDDLKTGVNTVPQWMRTWIEELLDSVKNK